MGGDPTLEVNGADSLVGECHCTQCGIENGRSCRKVCFRSLVGKVIGFEVVGSNLNHELVGWAYIFCASFLVIQKGQNGQS